MQIRRVVTGQSPAGKSAIVSDERVDPITVGLLPGSEFHRIWGSDELVKLPTTGEAPPAPAWFPPTGGFRFGFFTLAPEGVGMPEDVDTGEAIAELEEKVPGLADVLEPGNPGMHTTDTVDFQLILSGEVWLELDDGVEVHLAPGDCVVQNGTRHAWHNRSSQPCVMALALVGAAR
jgi:mannose-6-phosphate isomerase-like protein (cupin superfamily)